MTKPAPMLTGAGVTLAVIDRPEDALVTALARTASEWRAAALDAAEALREALGNFNEAVAVRVPEESGWISVAPGAISADRLEALQERLSACLHTEARLSAVDRP